MSKGTLLGMLLSVAVCVPPAAAQVTLDVSKITCEQFWLRKVASPEKIAIWLSGYFHGKTGNMMIDTQGLEETTAKITEHCRVHPKLTVVQAAQAVLAEAK